MERTMSQEDRIRRAEEIYQRRRVANGIRVSSNTVNRAEKKKLSLFKKMFLQLAICAVIYIIFYLIKNSNYIFSEDVIKKTKEFLSYDINFGNIGQQVTEFINQNKDRFPFLGIFGGNDEENENMESEVDANLVNVNAVTTNEVESNTVNANEIATNTMDTNTVGGVGGAVTNEIVEAEGDTKEAEKNTEQKSQYELDVEYIKENYHFTVPVEGTVTSRYGTREATEVVSANHAGIDIGANEGTAIYAAMDGIVTVSSEEGEYGKHIDITNGDVLTRYAHCSKLLVKEGDKVKQGDKIAEVGSTGNSTGPHLHFEIRRENRSINPEAILDFGQ